MEDRSRLEDLRQIPIADVGRPAGAARRHRRLRDHRATARDRAREPQGPGGGARHLRGRGLGRARKEAIEELMNAFNLPAGYSWSWNDRIVEQANEDAEMGVNFLLALVLVYLVMASLFESLTQPFAILFAIPFALPGAAWMLAAHRHPVQPHGADRSAHPDGHRGQQRHRAARPHQPLPTRRDSRTRRRSCAPAATACGRS